ncbi:MAG: haloacid dehalogenase type II [Beijerinckiaceae bacterium]
MKFDKRPPWRALVFDAYGTLFNVHAAVQAHAAALGPAAQSLSDTWRAKQLEYSWVRGLCGQWRDFWSLTGEALDFALAKHPQIDRNHREALLAAYETLDAYPEVHAVLTALRAQGVSLGILSNGSRSMLGKAVSAAQLQPLLDGVWSVDEVRQFKTAPAVYELARQALGIAASEMAMVSSNRWDIAGAKAFGMQAIWINRTAQPDEYPDLQPDATISDLRALLG